MRFIRGTALQRDNCNYGFSLYITVVRDASSTPHKMKRAAWPVKPCRPLSRSRAPCSAHVVTLHQKMVRRPSDTPVWFDVPGSSTVAAPVTLLKSTVPYTSVRLDSEYSATATPV